MRSHASIATAGFTQKIARQFEPGGKLTVHLAPPLFAERDPVTGHLKKRAYGPWIFTLFKYLAKLKGLRGTAFDPFGYTAERRTERRLITHYEALMVEILARLDHDNHALAVEIASLPEQIRGFGHVKERHLAEVEAQRSSPPRSLPPAPNGLERRRVALTHQAGHRDSVKKITGGGRRWRSLG